MVKSWRGFVMYEDTIMNRRAKEVVGDEEDAAW